MSQETPSRDAAAHVTRGNALARQQRLADALECYRCALALRPAMFEAHANLGSALVALGRFAEAEPHLLQALAERPDQAPLHSILGVAYASRGQLTEAETCLRRALAIAPDDAETHRRLGNVLRRLAKGSEAEESYRRALTLAPDHAETLVDLGHLLRHQLRFHDAESCYRRAFEIQPDDARAHYGLGHCLVTQGRVGEAIECFERAIAVKPDYVDAHYRLSVLRHAGATDAELARLEALQPRLAILPAPQQIRYWFALGKLREDRKRFDEAFAAYAEGNRLQCELMALDGGYAAREAFDSALVERIRTVFTADLIAAHRIAGSDAARVPVFIVGMPRSGTTLIEQILSAHPDVHGGGELKDLPEVLRSLGPPDTSGQGGYPEIVATLPDDGLRRIGGEYLDRVWRQAPQARFVTDKLTGNFLHAGMIHLVLPQAKIIHAVRDPMDSCFSCFANLFERGSILYSYDLGTLGRHCVRYLELMRHWRRVLPPGAILDVRYEDLVGDTENQVRRLLAHVGLPWDERCLSFHRHRREVRTVSMGQVSHPIYRSSVARWRHFEPHLGPLLEILGEHRQGTH